MDCSRNRSQNGFTSQQLKAPRFCSCLSGADSPPRDAAARGGFHLAARADQITMGEVIDFFLSRHPPEPNGDSAVMLVFEETSAPCQKAFSRLTLADIIN